MTGYIPTLEQIDELHRKIAPSKAAYELVHTHCVIVATIGCQIVRRQNALFTRRCTLPKDAEVPPTAGVTGGHVPPRLLDEHLVLIGGLLHDIGTYRVFKHDGSDGEPLKFSKKRYILHGLKGYEYLLDEGVAQAVRELRQAYPKSSYNCMIQSEDQLIALCAAGREKTSPRIVEIYDEYGRGEQAADYRVMRYRELRDDNGDSAGVVVSSSGYEQEGWNVLENDQMIIASNRNGTYRVFKHDGSDGEPLKFSKKRYILHGLKGYEYLLDEGVDESIAQFCRNHTGVGLTREDVVRQELPLPPADYVPMNLEQEVVMYADKFHSKSVPPKFLQVEAYTARAERFGGENKQRWLDLVAKYGVPDIPALAEKYGMRMI